MHAFGRVAVKKGLGRNRTKGPEEKNSIHLKKRARAHDQTRKGNRIMKKFKAIAGRLTELLALGMIGVLLLSACAQKTVREAPTPPKPRINAESLIKIGDVHLREGRFRNALKNYLEADSLKAGDAELKFRIGLIYSDYFNRYNDAIRYYREAVRLKENYSEAYNNLGVTYCKLKQWDEAIPMFQRALDNLFYVTPERAYYNLAMAHQGKGEYDKAEEYYKMAVELKPGVYDFKLVLAMFYQERGRHSEALTYFDQAIAVLENRAPDRKTAPPNVLATYDVTYAKVRYHQGQSLAALGRKKEAKEAYETALENAADKALKNKIQQALHLLESR